MQPYVGDDILLGDVLSFEIKPHWAVGPASTAAGVVNGPSTYPAAGNLPVRRSEWFFQLGLSLLTFCHKVQRANP